MWGRALPAGSPGQLCSAGSGCQRCCGGSCLPGSLAVGGCQQITEWLLLLGSPRYILGNGLEPARDPCGMVMPMGCWLQSNGGRVFFVWCVGFGPCRCSAAVRAFGSCLCRGRLAHHWAAWYCHVLPGTTDMLSCWALDA